MSKKRPRACPEPELPEQRLWLALSPATKISFFPLLALFLFFSPCHTHGADSATLVEDGSYLVASHNGQILKEFHADRLYTPASIFKIITALASVEIFGEEYRFPTYIYLTPGIDLWIKGAGDPLLTSEEIAGIAAALSEKGLRQFRNLYIDDSHYALEGKNISESATNKPYDTPLSALGVNFNTIHVEITTDGVISSGEEQTPTIPLMLELGTGLGPGRHRVNVSRENGQTERLAAETIRAIFARHDIIMRGSHTPRKTPSHAGLFHTHYSRPLIELLPAMLLYSNNFMANQLFLAMGSKEFGPPASWEKGRLAMGAFAERKGVTADEMTIIDGAGLNRGNRISAAAMLTFLQEFRPYHQLLPRHNNKLLKSGTMTGVYSYAGYLGEDQLAPAVVIMLNQERNNRDQLVERLAWEVAQRPAARPEPGVP